MKEKKWVSKILAIVCVIAVVFSSMELPLLTMRSEASQEYTVVDVKNYTGKDSETYTGAVNEIKTLIAGTGTLDGLMIDGIFNLTKYSSVLFGSSAHPNNRFQIGVTNQHVLYAQYVDRAGNVTRESFDSTYVGKETHMQIGFKFANKNETAGTADVTMRVKIGTTIDKEIVATGANMAQLANAMFVCPNTGTVTIKTMETSKTVDVSEYVGETEKTYTGAASQVQALTPGEGTLDGVMIDGIFNLSRYSSVLFGSSAHPNNRFQIGVNNGSVLYYQYVDRAGNVTRESFDSTYVGKDTRMQIGFVFMNKNETAGTADVVFKVKIGSTIDEQLTVLGVNMAQLANAMYVLPNTGSITLKTMQTKTTVNVKSYTGKDEETYTGAVNEIKELTAGEGTLDGIMIDGIYNLSRYSSILFGSSTHPNNRFQLGVNNGSNMYYQYVDRAGNVTQKVVGNSYTATDTRIQVGFVFTNKNETAGTADVVIKINIGDAIKEEMAVSGVNMAQLANKMYVLPNSGTVTIKAAPGAEPDEPEQPEQPEPPVNLEYDHTVIGVETLTGADETTYTGNAVKPGNNSSIEGIMLDGVYNFTGNACVYVGTVDWYGLRLQLDGANLKYWMAPGGSEYDKSVTPTEANVTAFAGEDVRIKVGIHTVSTNPDSTLNLAYKVCIGDYETAFLVKNVNKTQFYLLQRLHVVPGTGSLTVKKVPAEPEFVYTEIGVETLTGADEVTYTAEAKAGNNSAYEEILVDGIYNFTGNACVYVGTPSWYGLRLQLDGEKFKYWIADKGSEHDKSVTAEEAGVTAFAGQDVRIKVGIRTVKTNQDGTANMEYKVCIGNYTKIFVLKNVDKAAFVYSQRLHILPGTGTLTIKAIPPEPEFEYDVIDVKAWTGQDEVTYTAEAKPGNNGSLEGKMIDGIYNFTGNAAVYFGTADWYGLRMQLDGNNLKYWIAPNGSSHDVSITPTQAGLTTFAQQDVRIKVGIHTLSTNQDGTVNLEYKICIGEYEKKFTIGNVNKTQFQVSQRLHVVPGTGTVIIKTTVPPEEPEDEVDPTFEYNVVDAATLTLQDEITYTAEAKPGNNKVAEGDMIDGIFNFTGNGGVYFATPGWYGLKIQNDGTGLKYWIAPDGSTHDKTVTPTEAGCELAGKDVRIKVGVRTVRTNQDGTANMEYKICIGNYTHAFILKNVNKTTFNYAQRLHVVPGTGTVTVKTAIVKEPEKPIDPNITYNQTLSMKDFTGRDEVTYTAEAKPSAGDKSLNGVLIDGIYNITGNACMYIGAADWTGLRLELSGTDSLRYRFLPGDLGNTIVTPSEAGCLLAGEDVRIKIGYTFEEGTETDTTADVIVQVTIGNHKNTFRLKNVNKTSFVGRMFVYPQTGSVTLKHVAEASNEPQVPEGFKAKYDTEMKFTDFGITADTTTAGGEEKPNGGDTLSLDKVMVEGTYRFTGPQAAVYIGSRGWGGLRFGTTPAGELTYMFFDLNGKEAMHTTVLLPEDVGSEVLNTDLRIKTGFTIIKEYEKDGTVDAVIEVQIGDKYKELFVVEGVQRTNLIRGMHVYAPEGSSVVMKVDKSDLEYKDEPDDKKLSYKNELTFFDFGITKDFVVEEMQTRKVIPGTLDSVSIEGTYYMSGNAILGFGGDWRGLQFQRTKTGMLYQYLDTDGKGGIYKKSITEADTGCALYDKDVDIKVGFNFSNENKVEGTADVTIEVCIGPNYRDVFTVKGVKTANLNRHILLYAADAQSGLTGSKLILRKPYMEPFNFKEFGFTKNWKKELRL